MVKPVANLADDFLKVYKVKDVAILSEFPFQNYRDGVIVTMKPLALATKGYKVGGAETQIPFFYLNSVHRTIP
jgi:hypothetical protein